MFEAVVWSPPEEGGVSELDTHHKTGQGSLLAEEEEGLHQKKCFSAMWVLEIGRELTGCGESSW